MLVLFKGHPGVGKSTLARCGRTKMCDAARAAVCSSVQLNCVRCAVQGCLSGAVVAPD